MLVFLQNTSVSECLAAPMAPVGTFTCENTPFAVQRQYHQSKSCCIQHNTGHSSETVPPVSLAASNTTLVTVQRQYHQSVLLHPTHLLQFRDSTTSQSCCIQHNTFCSSETVPPVSLAASNTTPFAVQRQYHQPKILLHPTQHWSQLRDSTTSQSCCIQQTCQRSEELSCPSLTKS